MFKCSALMDVDHGVLENGVVCVCEKGKKKEEKGTGQGNGSSVEGSANTLEWGMEYRKLK